MISKRIGFILLIAMLLNLLLFEGIQPAAAYEFGSEFKVSTPAEFSPFSPV